MVSSFSEATLKKAKLLQGHLNHLNLEFLLGKKCTWSGINVGRYYKEEGRYFLVGYY